MDYITLGRTGLEVSVAGLGCGGFSRLGQRHGKSDQESIAVVQTAMDAGVNFLDTAEAYGTEQIVGKAVAGRDRDSVVISTKTLARNADGNRSGADVVASLDGSLSRLGLDHVDVFHLHAVRPETLDNVCQEIVPALLAERDKGKLRHIGITETAPRDPGHEMLERAVPSEHFDVVMVAFHMLHQSAVRTVFPLTRRHGVGTLIMFAVREVFSKPERLSAELNRLEQAGILPAELATADAALGFLTSTGGAASLIDAAYRYCRHTPGADITLFGTGNVDHVASNIASILAPPLPAPLQETLEQRFSHLTDVGLDAPSKG